MSLYRVYIHKKWNGDLNQIEVWFDSSEEVDCLECYAFTVHLLILNGKTAERRRYSLLYLKKSLKSIVTTWK